MRDEHIAVRSRAGLFDLSHMGEEARLTGSSPPRPRSSTAGGQRHLDLAPGSGPLLGGAATTTRASSTTCSVYRVEDGFLIVVNASRRQVDLEWMTAHLLAGTELRDESDETALLAVQGPEAVAIVQTLADRDVSGLHSFGSVVGGGGRGALPGSPAPGTPGRTGWSSTPRPGPPRPSGTRSSRRELAGA